MADFSFPQLPAVTPPPQTSLADMMGIARGAQAYQQAEQINPLDLQAKQLAVQQSQAINPLALRQQSAATALAENTLAPNISMASSKASQAATELNTAQLENLQRQQSNSTRNLLKLLSSPDPVTPKAIENHVISTMQNAGAPPAAIKQALQNLPTTGSDKELRAFLGTHALNSLTAEAQIEKLYPNVQMASAGGNIIPVTGGGPLAINAPGQQVGTGIPITLAPNQRAVDTGQKDLNGNSIFNIFDPNGKPIGQTTVPAGVSESQMPGAKSNNFGPAAAAPLLVNAPVRQRPGESADRYTAAQNLRTSASSAAAQVPMQQFNNNQIIKLADNIIGGKGAETFANLTGGYAALPFGSNNASNLNQLGHYMSLQTASLAKSSGLGETAGAINTQNQISGTTEWTPDAIKRTARVNRAFTTATDLFNKGISASFKKSNDPMSSMDFQNEWVNTLGSNGIEAIRLYDAMKNNDQFGIKDVVDAVGGPKTKAYQELIDKLGKINLLLKGQ